MSQPVIGAAENAFFEALGGHEKTAELKPHTRSALGLGLATPEDLKRLDSEAAQLMDGGAGSPLGAVLSPEQIPPAPTLEEEAQKELDELYGKPPASEGVNLPAPPATDEESAPDAEDGVIFPISDQLPGKLTHGKLFNNPETHPTVLFVTLSRRFMSSWVNWESETLWCAIRRYFGPVGDITKNKIEALRVAVKTDLPWQDWDVFEDCGLAWNGIIPIFGAFQPMTPSQTAFAVSILRMVRPDEEFSAEVSAYMAAVLDDAGFVLAPEEWFPGAQAFLDRNEEIIGFKMEVDRFWQPARKKGSASLALNSEKPLDLHIAKLFVIEETLQRKNAELAALSLGPASSSATPVP